VRDAVLQLALEHHLVSRYTSLVAIDRTPSRPPEQGLQSAGVPTRLPAGWSATAVFGRLPGTATPAALYLLAGLAGLAVAFAARRRR
jgi:Ca-activated chloride channel family protein